MHAPEAARCGLSSIAPCVREMGFSWSGIQISAAGGDLAAWLAQDLELGTIHAVAGRKVCRVRTTVLSGAADEDCGLDAGAVEQAASPTPRASGLCRWGPASSRKASLSCPGVSRVPANGSDRAGRSGALRRSVGFRSVADPGAGARTAALVRERSEAAETRQVRGFATGERARRPGARPVQPLRLVWPAGWWP